MMTANGVLRDGVNDKIVQSGRTKRCEMHSDVLPADHISPLVFEPADNVHESRGIDVLFVAS